MTLRRKHIGNLQELPAPRRFLDSALRAPLGMTKRRRPEHIPQQPVGNINMRLPVLRRSIPLQHRRNSHPQLVVPHQVLNHDRVQGVQLEEDGATVPGDAQAVVCDEARDGLRREEGAEEGDEGRVVVGPDGTADDIGGDEAEILRCAQNDRARCPIGPGIKGKGEKL